MLLLLLPFTVEFKNKATKF